MSPAAGGSEVEEKASAEERASLTRLLQSETFATAPRLLEVLTFLVSAYLQGRTDELTEQSIGQAVFGRPPGYSSADDNIVRVTVRHLRSRLEDFYRAEGRDEPVMVEIPKGKYVPVLVNRETSIVTTPPEPLAAPVLPVTVLPPSAARLSTRPPWPWMIAILVLLGVCGVLGYRLYRLRAAQPAAQAAPREGLLEMLQADGNGLSVVLADSNLQAYREIFQKQVLLDDYLKRTYLSTPPESSDPRLLNAWVFVSGDTETNVSSSIVGADIARHLPGMQVFLKHPHEVSMRDLQHKDIVFLGGPWINPWGQLFEQSLNFRLLPEAKSPSQSEIWNRSPAPGEPQWYVPHQEGGFLVNYARVAVLPNFSNDGHVVLVGATSPGALEAGGAFLSSESSLRELLQKFGKRSASQLPPFEVVMEVNGVQSVPSSVRSVAQRTLATPTQLPVAQ